MKARTAAKLMSGALAIVTALAFGLPEADARAGRGGSVGSRGSNTFSAPPSTNTAPKATAPIQKSITQPGQATSAAQASRAGSAAAAQPSRFGGLKGILLGGLIGAALASFLGPGMLASMLGGLLWLLLIGGVIMLAVGFFARNRAGAGQPAPAYAQPASGANTRPDQAAYRTAAGAAGSSAPALVIGKPDYDAFERLLVEIQDAYGRGDVNALGERTTPEMLSYFAQDLDENRKQGVRNEVSGAKLLQGDLAESWRDASGEYATVAMRYALNDVTVEAGSGRVVSGSRTQPDEVTEVWTFRRPLRGAPDQWELSAIQQTA